MCSLDLEQISPTSHAIFKNVTQFFHIVFTLFCAQFITHSNRPLRTRRVFANILLISSESYFSQHIFLITDFPNNCWLLITHVFKILPHEIFINVNYCNFSRLLLIVIKLACISLRWVIVKFIFVGDGDNLIFMESKTYNWFVIAL